MDSTEQPEAREAICQRLDIIEATVRRIEALLEEQRTIKEWYSIAEAAESLRKAPFTIREWCRLGRVNAHKRQCGRGRSQEWMLSHNELQRIKDKGLLPTDL